MPPLENQAETTEALDYILLFVQTQEEFIDPFPHLKKLSKPQGMLSVSWPQGGKQGTELYLKSVIPWGYVFGLVLMLLLQNQNLHIPSAEKSTTTVM